MSEHSNNEFSGGDSQVAPEDAKPNPAEAKSKQRKTTHADTLLELAASVSLFHAPDGTAFADIVVNGHRETWPVRARAHAGLDRLPGGATGILHRRFESTRRWRCANRSTRR